MPTGAYIDVRDLGTRSRNEVLRRKYVFYGKTRRYKQDEEGAAFPTGVYIDVHDRGKT